MSVELLKNNTKQIAIESHRISILKTISWRFIGTLDTFLISLILTGNLSLAIGIGGVDTVVKMILYYFHERLWLLDAFDNDKKAILKTFSWRAIGSLSTIFISYVVIGQAEVALGIGTIEIVTKMILYYFHERIWQKNIKK